MAEQREGNPDRKDTMARDLQQVSITLSSLSKLLMHNDTLADPLDPRTKEFKKVSGKRTKTDGDYEEMARLEFAAGLYLSNGIPVMPFPNLMRCFIEGARMSKSGPKVERGVQIVGGDFPLEYDGPKSVEALYADKRFVSRMTVKVGMARTVRCRPIFNEWGLSFKALIDPTVIDIAELDSIVENAGAFIGLGDYRKAGGFGRFTAELGPA